MLKHCEHTYIFLPNEPGPKWLVVQECQKCKGIKKTPLGLSKYELEGATLCEVLNLRREQISVRTNLDKRKVVLKPGIFRTKYFAQKKALEIALLLLHGAEFWEDVRIEIPFRRGLIQATVSAVELAKINPSLIAPKDARFLNGFLEHATTGTVEAFAERFSVCRFSRYVRPGGRLERMLIKLRGYQRIYK